MTDYIIPYTGTNILLMGVPMNRRKPAIDDGYLPAGYLQRKTVNRRQSPTSMLSKYTFVGCRRKNRRQDDVRQNYYVDVFDGKLLRLVLLIIFLSALDAVLTLTLLERGAAELNPIIDFYLRLGNNYFFIFKLIITGIGALTLLIHQNFKLIRKIIMAIYSAYILLITYQLTLLMIRS